MRQHFKPNDFAQLFAPPPSSGPITPAAIPAPSPPDSINWVTAGTFVVVVGLAIALIYAVQQISEMSQEIRELSQQVSRLDDTMPALAGSAGNSFSTNKSNNHETKSTADAGNGFLKPIG